MNAFVGRKFGVKRCDKHVFLFSKNNFSAVISQNLNSTTHADDSWRTNKHCVKGFVERLNFNFGFKTIDLPAVCISLNFDINRTKRNLVIAPVNDFVRQQNHSGAGTKYGHTFTEQLFYGFK